jgi:hypothetical protein
MKRLAIALCAISAVVFSVSRLPFYLFSCLQSRIAVFNSLSLSFPSVSQVFALGCDGSFGGGVGLSASSLKVLLLASSIAGGIAVNSSIPLFYEMAVESAFPVSQMTSFLLILP